MSDLVIPILITLLIVGLVGIVLRLEKIFFKRRGSGMILTKIASDYGFLQNKENTKINNKINILTNSNCLFIIF